MKDSSPPIRTRRHLAIAAGSYQAFSVNRWRCSREIDFSIAHHVASKANRRICRLALELGLADFLHQMRSTIVQAAS